MSGERRLSLFACATSIVAVCAMASLGGCASPYGPNTLVGGYHTEKLDESHWLVRYDGNGNTPRDQVWAYWLYRCAEVTQQNGYSYFTLLRSNWTPPAAAPASKPSRVAWPSATDNAWQARQAILSRDAGVRALPVHAVGGIIIVPGYGGAASASWHSDAVVAMFREHVPSDTPLVMSAQSVLADLDAYVKGQDKRPIDRDLLMRHGLRWISTSGAVLPPMEAPTAPPRWRSPVRLLPRPRIDGGLES